MSNDEIDDETPTAAALAALLEAHGAAKPVDAAAELDRAMRRAAADARRAAIDSMRAGAFPAAVMDAAFVIADGDARETPALVRARRFRDQDLRSGRPLLVLSGGVGSGKTTAAAWVIASMRFPLPRFLRATTFARTSRYDAAANLAWSKAGALVLDDLGAEYIDSKGSFLTDLDELLDTYYADRRPLIITTNLGVDEFRDRYGGREGRIASRIREAGAWAQCGGLDLRGSAQ